MSSLAVGLIAFVFIFGGALLGMSLRGAMPQNHLSDDSKDSVKLGMGLVATMCALVLGLLIASAKTYYDTQNAELTEMSAKIVLLDRTACSLRTGDQRVPRSSAQRRRALNRSTVAALGVRRDPIWTQQRSAQKLCQKRR